MLPISMLPFEERQEAHVGGASLSSFLSVAVWRGIPENNRKTFGSVGNNAYLCSGFQKNTIAE